MADAPTNPLEAAADAAMEAFDAAVRELGGETVTTMVFAHTRGLSPNAVTSVNTEDEDLADPRGLLSFLLAQATEVAKSLGIELQFISTDQIGQG